MTQKARRTFADMLRAKRLIGKEAPKLIRAVAVFLLVAVIAVLGGAGYVSTIEASTIAPGVRVMDVQLGGLAPEAAKERLRSATESLTLTYSDRDAVLRVMPASPDATEEGPIATYDIDAAVARAAGIGQHRNPFIALFQRAKARALTTNIALPFDLDEQRLTRTIEERFGLLTRPAQNARLEVSVDASGDAAVRIVPEAEGLVFNDAELIGATNASLRMLAAAEMPVTVMEDLPTIRAADIEPLRDEALRLLENLPIKVAAGENRWTIDARTAAPWISAIPSARGGVEVIVDPTSVAIYLKPRADLLAVQPKDAVFVEKDGRAAEFVPSQNGAVLDMETSVVLIADAILNGVDEAFPVLQLPIIADFADIATGTTNPYGIKELIGVGESNFKGSPKNRRINIEIGRASLDGILVHPGEEFSLLKALGEIDGEHGYLQELVIKENKTIPEYGGGLCQIGTTTFRAVLASGLPVTERRNHSYRVPYYERDGDGNLMGPGKDATIYNPAPDFKFVNDMPTSILIRTRIIGTDKLVFEFWGTKDGRIAEQTDAVILNSTPPPPKKEIKTTSIPAGTVRCTESPHSGATVKFSYTVAYPDGRKEKRDFLSYYKPWGEVCLVGVTQEELDAAQAAGAVDDEGAIIVSADAAGVTGQ